MNLNKLMKFILLMGFGCCILFILSACENEKDQRIKAINEAEVLVAKDIEAWVNDDVELAISNMSEDFIGYDALIPGWSYNYDYAVKMSQDQSYWDNTKVSDTSSFVSWDGKFGVISTKFEFLKDQAGVPNLHLVAIKEGKIYYAFDYYGLTLSPYESIPAFQPRTLEPGSDEADTLVEQAVSITQTWQKAYNDRNLEDFMRCYGETLRVVYFEKPEWRILSIDEFEKETSADFAKPEFLSNLSAPSTSPIPDGIFVSVDGHYAVAQGSYEVKGSVGARPMAIVIEISDGKIVRQYNYRR